MHALDIDQNDTLLYRQVSAVTLGGERGGEEKGASAAGKGGCCYGVNGTVDDGS